MGIILISNRIRIILILSSVFSFALLTYALLIISINPCNGYELSIYSSTQIIYWIAIIIGLLDGILLIVHSIFVEDTKLWIAGIIEIVLCNVTVISLYALRGYVSYMPRGDTLTYIGMAKDINIYGFVPDYNFYPIVSILIAQINQLSSLPLLLISRYLQIAFYVLYSIFICLWARALINKRNFVLSTFLASTPLFFAWFMPSIYHQMLSVMILPLFFYLIHHNYDMNYRYLIVILCIAYPFWHPILAVFFGIYLTVWFFTEMFDKKLINIVSSLSSKHVSLSMISLYVVTLLAWFINQYQIVRSVTSTILPVVNSLKVSSATEAGYFAGKLGFFSAIKSLFIMINDELIYYILSFILIYISIKHSSLYARKYFFPIINCLILGSFSLILIFFLADIHGPYRLINLDFNVIFAIPLVGLLLFETFEEKSRIKIILLLFLILIASFSSIISIYPSQLEMRPNDYGTQKDLASINWLIFAKDPGFKTADILSPINRYADLIYGFNYRLNRTDLYRDLDLPDHFGFKGNNIFPIDNNRYLMITTFDIKSYTEIWEQIHRFEKADFDEVNYCTNVMKLYENGDCRFYLINKS